MVEGPPPTAIVVAKATEDRILLRALLRLHHVPAEAEADGATQALKLLRERRITHMVLDSALSDGTAASLIAECRALSPDVQIILLTHGTDHVPESPGLPGPPVVRLVRPFRFQDFAEALGVHRPTARPPGAPERATR